MFANHFQAIAEQMGLALRNTAASVNVKERLDYSCALFDSAGQLVVNAPHIPVHLGAMSETVQAVLADNPDLRPGDVVVTNDPYRGGSHLPDVTVVTPVHAPQTGELLFLTASRAQNAADAAALGGVVFMPGDMAQATSVATDVAKAHGFSGVTIGPGTRPNQLRVTATKQVDTLFVRALGINNVTVRRSALAEYEQPVAAFPSVILPRSVRDLLADQIQYRGLA